MLEQTRILQRNEQCPRGDQGNAQQRISVIAWEKSLAEDLQATTIAVKQEKASADGRVHRHFRGFEKL